MQLHSPLCKNGFCRSSAEFRCKFALPLMQLLLLWFLSLLLLFLLLLLLLLLFFVVAAVLLLLLLLLLCCCCWCCCCGCCCCGGGGSACCCCCCCCFLMRFLEVFFGCPTHMHTEGQYGNLRLIFPARTFTIAQIRFRAKLYISCCPHF